jgi:alpha-L-rhamnosidase
LPTDDAWAAFSPGKVSITQEMERLISPALMSAILSAGYNIDYIDADAINKLGIHYPLLVIPPTSRISAETLAKIQHYLAGGGKVVCVGRTPPMEGGAQHAADESSLGDALHKSVAPDFRLQSNNDEVGFIRRKLPGADIYFVANTSNHPVAAQAAFATTHKFSQRWDAETGAAVAVSGPAAIALSLAAYESAIFVFSDTPSRGAASPAAEVPLADLSTDWKVTFTSTGKSLSEPFLADWTKDPATRFYSGEAVYERNLTLDKLPAGEILLEVEGGAQVTQPTGRTGPGMRAWYDPPVREAAIVTINGRRVGSLWHPPYRLPVGGFLKPGKNHIVIKVYNTAINAWAALPPHDYQPLIAKYGDRFQMQDLDQVKPAPSGLLGTIRLVTR